MAALLGIYNWREKKQKRYLPARSVRMGKNCALTPGGLGPFLRAQAQFFPIQTPQPVNNIYVISIVI